MFLSIFSSIQNVTEQALLSVKALLSLMSLIMFSPIFLNMLFSLQYVLRMFASISSPIRMFLTHVFPIAKCSWACSLLRMFLRMFFLSYAKCFWAYCLLKDALVMLFPIRNALGYVHPKYAEFSCTFIKRIGFWSIGLYVRSPERVFILHVFVLHFYLMYLKLNRPCENWCLK